MGMRPYAADCGVLVLPLASKVKLRAPSKDLYETNDDIRIEIPRQARDDKQRISYFNNNSRKQNHAFALAHPCLRASALAGKVNAPHFYNGVP